MTGRKCGACKHFEPAPIWRKGWCRNPLLYSPQQSHLVFEDDLDCERGMGNYWEPVDQAATESTFSEPVARILGRGPAQTTSGQPVFIVSGSSGYGSDPQPPSSGGPPSWGSGGGRGSGDGGDYFGGGGYDEERYWTDYLRIAAPVLGVFLLIVLFWFWVSNFLGDDDNGQGANGTATTTLPTTQITATATGAAASGTGTLPIVTPGASTTPSGTSTGGDATPTTPIAPPGGEIYAGATVEVANTGGSGVNVRLEPNTASEVVTVALDGQQFVTVESSVEGEGYVWWPVDYEGTVGWIVQDYLILIE